MSHKRTVTPDYKEGDLVWLSSDFILLNQPAKLRDRWLGPYPIIKVLDGAVELQLPKTLRIHPVVNVSRVKPHVPPLSSQASYPPAPVSGSDLPLA
ncbi:hypothetical protein ID866_9406 [Astraeus odoratus]|nr:hypothetical protein ID866_9406 [Astraeus odoratus]